MSDVGLPARPGVSLPSEGEGGSTPTPLPDPPLRGRGVYGSYRLRPEKLGSFRGWVTE